MDVQVERWVIQLDEEKTKEYYANAPYYNEDLFALNYIEVCSFCDPEVLAFFQQLGVDILKPSSLHYLSVEGDCIMYSGSYYVVGEKISGELDEWDVVVDHFCFALTEGNYDKPLQCPEPAIEISFEVVLPWMLFEPMPTV